MTKRQAIARAQRRAEREQVAVAVVLMAYGRKRYYRLVNQGQPLDGKLVQWLQPKQQVLL